MTSPWNAAACPSPIAAVLPGPGTWQHVECKQSARKRRKHPRRGRDPDLSMSSRGSPAQGSAFVPIWGMPIVRESGPTAISQRLAEPLCAHCLPS
jgi:hypothetical protein